MSFKVPPTSMLTVGEVARMLQIHENTVRRWSNQGILKAYRFGKRGDRRFVKAEVEAVITRPKENEGKKRVSPKDVRGEC
jgi:excisionase family DNA binding protein